jgi:DNA-binding HxlR family transcriptional regulator
VGLVESTSQGYVLTRSGRGLKKALKPLHDWSARWASQLPKR